MHVEQATGDASAALVTLALILLALVVLGSRWFGWLDRLTHWLLVRPQARAARLRHERS